MNIESTSFRSEKAPPAGKTSESSSEAQPKKTTDIAADQATNSFEDAEVYTANASTDFLDSQTLTQLLSRELRPEVKDSASDVETLASRIAAEVDRICHKSGRIQTSGQVRSWQLSLARHRLQKCLTYYQLGSRRGRVELHSTLGSMIYRYVAPNRMQLGFQARYNLIEDFLQGFYTESLKAFRRENELPENYQPRTRLELAEYMAFTEQYAKRRITLPIARTSS